MGCKPPFDVGVFMRRVVVQHEVDSQVGRHVGIDLFQKLEIFLMTMATLAGREHLACGNIECSKQGGGAMADVVVRHSFDIAEPHG